MRTLTKSFLVTLVGIAVLGLPAAAQDGGGGFLAFRLSPAYGIPLSDEEIVAPGVNAQELWEPGFQAGAALHLNASGILQPTVNADFHQISFGSDESNLVVFSGGAGALVSVPVADRFRLFAFGEGGYFSGQAGDNISGSNPYFSTGAGFGFRLFPAVQLNLEANYVSFYDLYNGLGAGLSVTLGGGGAPRSRTPREQNVLPTQPGRLDGSDAGFSISSVELTDVFPVLFRYYNETPIGTAVFANETGAEVHDLVVRFNVPEFMSASKVSAEIDTVAAGAQQSVDLYALFTDDVLNLTEGSTVAATVSYEFSVDNNTYEAEESLSLEFKNRNAITWDDDRKAAVFVTAQDEDVLRFSRNVAAIIGDSAIAALPREFQLGLAMHAAVSAHGMSYVVDPTTPYQELSSNTGAVDLLQFPRQTLQFKAGDCDDLSILYCSLMQAVGVDTAFVTIPGHIYAAFRLDITPEQARETFLRSGDLVYRDNQVWLPLEITLIDEGFMEAWAVGARQYRDHYSDGNVGFYPISDAWTVYQPVTFRSNINVALPDQETILPEFRTQLQRFVSREIYQQEQTLIARIERNESPRYINRLGVLYAKYGLKEKALEQFSKILERQDYGPALLNVGNMKYLENAIYDAVEYYERAATAAPENGAVLLANARANFEIENYGTVNRYYNRLVSVDPDLADRFSYLSSNADITTRASDAARMRGVVVWADEEDDDE